MLLVGKELLKSDAFPRPFPNPSRARLLSLSAKTLGGEWLSAAPVRLHHPFNLKGFANPLTTPKLWGMVFCN